jgi:hypothetical protein
MTYANFKAICGPAKKNLAWQYEEYADRFEIWARDGGDRYETTIYKSNAAVDGIDKEQESANLADFETNFKALSNWATGSRLYPFATGDFDHAANRIPVTTITEWTSGDGEDSYADLFFKIDEADIYMDGGELFCYSGFAAGDWAEMFIMDKDGVYSPAGTILKTWVYGKNLGPHYQAGMGHCHCDTPYAGNPPNGVYLAVRYHRSPSSGGNRQVGVNFKLHRAI